MSYLWRSVVGKLWMTIIGLVAIVLLILTFLLVQFFDDYYNERQEENLHNLASQIASLFESDDHTNRALRISAELVEASDTSLTVLGSSEQVWYISADKGMPNIDEAVLFDDYELNRVFFGESVMIRDHFPVQENGETQEFDVVMVAVPIMNDRHEPDGAVFLYQTLDVINETIEATKQIILYSAGIGIVLTTVFAFFLSTRITHPLRQMKVAVAKMEEGDFNTRVPSRSRDEIGELALMFNHMAQHLDDSIQELSHEKEHLSSILRSMVDGVVTVDVQGEVVMLNPPAEKMLKTWKYEENGNGVDHALPKRFLDLLEQVVADHKELVKTVSAQGRFWTIVMAPLYNEEKIRGAVAVIRDMTEERRSDKLRKDFVANVSHELRTPLSMLQGYSEALVDDLMTSKEEQQELIQVIHDESLRMGRLVNELLDLARMEAGNIELIRRHEVLSPIVQRTFRKFSNLAREQQVDLIEDIEQTQQSYQLDADRIEQIFTNLINNAIRHTPSKGQVRLTLREDEQGAYIELQDNGVGIPEADLPFVFERFYKADKARTRGKSGTGIGLAIVKHLVEAHHGHIQVHSKEGEGTTFSIFLPAEHHDSHS